MNNSRVGFQHFSASVSRLLFEGGRFGQAAARHGRRGIACWSPERADSRAHASGFVRGVRWICCRCSAPCRSTSVDQQANCEANQPRGVGMRRIRRQMRVTVTDRPSFRRCQVICRAPSSRLRAIGWQYQHQRRVNLGLPLRHVMRHCAPTDSLGWARSITSRLTCRPGMRIFLVACHRLRGQQIAERHAKLRQRAFWPRPIASQNNRVLPPWPVGARLSYCNNHWRDRTEPRPGAADPPPNRHNVVSTRAMSGSCSRFLSRCPANALASA